jgi:hypothetical protein
LLTFKLGHWPHEEVRARNRDFGVLPHRPDRLGGTLTHLSTLSALST